jgi:hypothetical protein
VKRGRGDDASRTRGMVVVVGRDVVYTPIGRDQKYIPVCQTRPNNAAPQTLALRLDFTVLERRNVPLPPPSTKNLTNALVCSCYYCSHFLALSLGRHFLFLLGLLLVSLELSRAVSPLAPLCRCYTILKQGV